MVLHLDLASPGAGWIASVLYPPFEGGYRDTLIVLDLLRVSFDALQLKDPLRPGQLVIVCCKSAPRGCQFGSELVDRCLCFRPAAVLRLLDRGTHASVR